eukprot:TRINITY_DN888_c0_g1_i3.p1 TRINITY_DN888_c0_g1~~TRINITY_DN888_c0_g1_i3.p1  ORF type:complete len:684 (-),score=108.23 TRINITY_DN888_c0_g1_i3:298-2076(-)
MLSERLSRLCEAKPHLEAVQDRYTLTMRIYTRISEQEKSDQYERGCENKSKIIEGILTELIGMYYEAIDLHIVWLEQNPEALNFALDNRDPREDVYLNDLFLKREEELKSQKKKKKKKPTPVDSNKIKCSICDVYVSTKGLQKHFSGKQHLKNQRKNESNEIKKEVEQDQKETETSFSEESSITKASNEVGGSHSSASMDTKEIIAETIFPESFKSKKKKKKSDVVLVPQVEIDEKQHCIVCNCLIEGSVEPDQYGDIKCLTCKRTCDICKKTFKNRKELKLHKKSCNGVVKKPKPVAKPKKVIANAAKCSRCSNALIDVDLVGSQLMCLLCRRTCANCNEVFKNTRVKKAHEHFCKQTTKSMVKPSPTVNTPMVTKVRPQNSIRPPMKVAEQELRKLVGVNTQPIRRPSPSPRPVVSQSQPVVTRSPLLKMEIDAINFLRKSIADVAKRRVLSREEFDLCRTLAINEEKRIRGSSQEYIDLELAKGRLMSMISQFEEQRKYSTQMKGPRGVPRQIRTPRPPMQSGQMKPRAMAPTTSDHHLAFECSICSHPLIGEKEFECKKCNLKLHERCFLEWKKTKSKSICPVCETSC